MTKVFISLPMKNKTRAEILTEQKKILARVYEELGESVMLVESYMRELYSQKPLECLGENIKRIAHADYVVFADGWENSRGCVIERMCAEKYGVPILELESYQKNEDDFTCYHI